MLSVTAPWRLRGAGIEGEVDGCSNGRGRVGGAG